MIFKFAAKKSQCLSVACIAAVMTIQPWDAAYAVTPPPAAGPAPAAAAATSNDFSAIATNMVKSIQSLPGLLTAVSYLLGLLIGVLGILKLKDHVESPNNTPLKDGVIRLCCGGALFALPIMYQAMYNTIGSGATVSAATLTEIGPMSALVK